MNKGKLVFDPTKWILVNGLLIPRSAVKLVPAKSDLDRDVIVYAPFEELYPKQENSLKLIEDEYGSFFVKDVFQVLAKINFLASFSYYKDSSEDIKVISPFLDDYPLSIFLHQKEKRKALSRQQLLANIRCALLYCSSNPDSKKVFQNEKEFGKLIFRVTDLMEDIDKEDKADLSKWPGKKKLFISMARNLVFKEASTFVLSLARYWYIFNKISALTLLP